MKYVSILLLCIILLFCGIFLVMKNTAETKIFEQVIIRQEEALKEEIEAEIDKEIVEFSEYYRSIRPSGSQLPSYADRGYGAMEI